ncbi:MAG: Rqc2 family fibronectin-binding protein [Halanaerobiaceae bacterium]
MAIDGIMLANCRHDLNKNIINGRIDKIYQPEKTFLTILIRNNNQNYKLLSVIDPRQSRVHLTDLNFDNPKNPPTFTMVLRKHLTYGIIKKIEQPGFERILKVTIENNNKKFYLYLEIMGRYSNVILTDQDHIILDAQKRMGPDENSARTLMPKIEYKFPPPQDKIDPRELKRENFEELIKDDTDKYLPRALLNNIQGFGPDSTKEIVYRAGIDLEKTYSELKEAEKIKFQDQLFNWLDWIKTGKFQPAVGFDNDEEFKIIYQSAFPLTYLQELENIEYKTFENSGTLFDFFYKEHIIKRDLAREKKRLQDIIANYLEKNQRKQNKVRGKLEQSKHADKYKRRGELLKSQLHKIDRGASEVTLVDYYDEDQPEVKIQLDSDKSPAENVRRLFKKYNKLKKSRSHLVKELAKLRHEDKYLQNVEVELSQAETEDELSEIAEELKEEGYIKKNKQKSKGNKKLPPRKYISADNYQILVGRNNRQNDYLTKKIANQDDIWVHTRKIAGSHVIIKRDTDKPVPEPTIYEAALLAAYFSKARESENVPVDYTKVKNVNKPKGAKPGIVYYENHQSIYVTPNEAELKEILKRTAKQSN